MSTNIKQSPTMQERLATRTTELTTLTEVEVSLYELVKTQRASYEQALNKWQPIYTKVKELRSEIDILKDMIAKETEIAPEQ